jgi:hypothetical protein
MHIVMAGFDKLDPANLRFVCGVACMRGRRGG